MPSRGPRSQMDRSSFGGPSIWNRGAHPSPEIIHIGCAGWNIPRQSVAHFELEGTHLERYSRTFNCCEINSSFYRPTQVFYLGTMVRIGTERLSIIATHLKSLTHSTFKPCTRL